MGKFFLINFSEDNSSKTSIEETCKLMAIVGLVIPKDRIMTHFIGVDV